MMDVFGDLDSGPFEDVTERFLDNFDASSFIGDDVTHTHTVQLHSPAMDVLKPLKDEADSMAPVEMTNAEVITPPQRQVTSHQLDHLAKDLGFHITQHQPSASPHISPYSFHDGTATLPVSPPPAPRNLFPAAAAAQTPTQQQHHTEIKCEPHSPGSPVSPPGFPKPRQKKQQPQPSPISTTGTADSNAKLLQVLATHFINNPAAATGLDLSQLAPIVQLPKSPATPTHSSPAPAPHTPTQQIKPHTPPTPSSAGDLVKQLQDQINADQLKLQTLIQQTLIQQHQVNLNSQSLNQAQLIPIADLQNSLPPAANYGPPPMVNNLLLNDPNWALQHVAAGLQLAPENEELAPAQRPGFKGCNCKRSKCLKLYCECFASQQACGLRCRCDTCYNTGATELEDIRQRSVTLTLLRNKKAFSKSSSQSNSQGCRCKKSHCLKNYCECFQVGKQCSIACRCSDCGNVDKSTPRQYNTAVKHEDLQHLSRSGSKRGSATQYDSLPPLKRQNSGQANKPLQVHQIFSALLEHPGSHSQLKKELFSDATTAGTFFQDMTSSIMA